jgi:hypothetical protein
VQQLAIERRVAGGLRLDLLSGGHGGCYWTPAAWTCSQA